MGTDTKNIARVGGGFSGKKQPQKSIIFRTGLLGQDGTGLNVERRIQLNYVKKTERKETADSLQRRKQGYRGL